MILCVFKESIEKILIACVLPGALLVLASFLFPVNAFKTLDLPELDLPQNATSEPKSSGRSFKEKALIRNLVWRKIFLDFMALLNLNTWQRLVYNPRPYHQLAQAFLWI